MANALLRVLLIPLCGYGALDNVAGPLLKYEQESIGSRLPLARFDPLALVACQLADALLWFDDFGGFNEIASGTGRSL
jgi:hypothetical protein